ncbi:hypothetical protein EBV26_17080, partial [bacterium]|nr:hypothetical protein [bacterium]
EILNPPEKPIPDNILFDVDAKYVYFDDDVKDPVHTAEYVNNLKNAMNANNYNLQRIETIKASIPFEKNENGHNVYLDSTAHIILENNGFSKLLTEDNLSLGIKGASFNKKTIKVSDKYKFVSEIINDLKPKIIDVIKKHIDSLTDLRTLRLLLKKFNIDFDTDINNEVFIVLQEYFETLVDKKEDDIEEKSEKVKNDYPSIEPLSFNNVLVTIIDKLRTYNIDRVKEALSIILAPLSEKIDKVPNPINIIDDLKSNSTTIDDVVALITKWVSTLKTERAKVFFNDLQYFKLPENTDKIFVATNKFQYREQKFLTLYSDIHDVVEGTNTSKYDGNIGSFNIYDEVTEWKTPEAVIDEIEVPKYTFLSKVKNEGLKELLNYIIPVCDNIKNISGLPWNLESLSNYIEKKYERNSRLEQLKLLNKDVSVVILQKQIDTNPIVMKEWTTIKKTVLIDVFSNFWLDTWNNLLEGSLEFVPGIHGSFIYIQYWKTTGKGILEYLNAIVEDIKELDWKTFEKDVSENVATNYSDKFKELTELSKIKAPITDAVTRAQMSFYATYELAKTNKGANILPGYITSFINLPSLLPQIAVKRKQITWMMGCCLVNLNENYTVDSDWNKKLVALWKMKLHLAKDRWLKDRPPLRVYYGQKIKKKEKEKEEEEELPLDIEDMEKIDEIVIDVNESISNTDIKNMEYDGNKIFEICKTNLSKNFTKAQSKFLNENLFLNNLRYDQIITIMNGLIKLNTQSENIDTLIEIKRTLLKFSEAQDVSLFTHKGMYLLTKVLLLANEKTRKAYYEYIYKWIDTNKVMTLSEIADFITYIRETQKDLSLQKLDIMDDDDRENISETKRLKLSKLITQEELLKALNEEQPVQEEVIEEPTLEKIDEANEDDAIKEFFPHSNDEDFSDDD